MENPPPSAAPESPQNQPPSFPFAIIVPTIYGNMIVNRHDIDQTNALIKTGGAVDHPTIVYLARLLRLGEKNPTFIDIGANIGTYSLALAHFVGRGGEVHAFEAQRIVFNMLAGTMALNGFTHVHCYNMAVGAEQGMLEVPQFDYNRELNFGSIEFGHKQIEPLSQARGQDPSRAEFVPVTPLDLFEFARADLIKIDVEGMEESVLEGAQKTIAACRPILYVEFGKSDKEKLAQRIIGMDYEIHQMENDFLCVPKEAMSKLLAKAGVTAPDQL
jgi:FkbM family methyltransferase